MIKIYDSKNITAQEIISRQIADESAVEQAVEEIISQVRRVGDYALFDCCRRFDGVELAELAVSEQEILEAKQAVGEEFYMILRKAAQNIYDFHIRQKREGFMFTKADGQVLGQRILPLKRVGLYVPGGTASYPSSVLMNAIPARVAGVEEIIMVTPPNKQGKIAAEILAAAEVAGVKKIFKLGGAQAVAALAFGTQSVPAVDKIVGPGNIFVAMAKRKVYGVVDIDMIAGPSEILIIADAAAEPRLLAADLLSQAEHDKLAAAVLITVDKAQAEAVATELERQIPQLPRAEIARASIDDNGKIIVAADLDEAARLSDLIAPEHLELAVADPFALMSRIHNAGSIFLGRHTPEPLGDYFAGPNHVLPTGGTARFSSPLSVDDFVKKSSYIYYTKEALAAVRAEVATFAAREGLSAHARSILMRFEEEDN